MTFITDIQAIEWMLRLTAVFILIDSAEKLSSYSEFKEDGFFSWKLLSANRFFASLSERVCSLLSVLFNFRVWLFLLILRGISGLWLFLSPQQGVETTSSLISVFVISSLMNFRNAPFGAETENRLVLMIIGAILLRSIAPTHLVTTVCTWFIALQSCLSYLTSGVSKLLNQQWQKGNGLLNVINDPDLVPAGNLTIFFSHYQNFGKLLCWTLIGIECAFPLVLVIGAPWFFLFLIWGMVFHIINAIVLRLGKFFWVWMATYPAIIFVAQ